MPILPKAANVLLKGFPKAASDNTKVSKSRGCGQFSVNLRKIVCNGFLKSIPLATRGHRKPVPVATSGFRKPFHDNTSIFQNPFKPVEIELENISSFRQNWYHIFRKIFKRNSVLTNTKNMPGTTKLKIQKTGPIESLI
jgi:hypothetical protein